MLKSKKHTKTRKHTKSWRCSKVRKHTKTRKHTKSWRCSKVGSTQKPGSTQKAGDAQKHTKTGKNNFYFQKPHDIVRFLKINFMIQTSYINIIY
ncbi:hypothetical protein [Mycoplasmopsis cynos]|uniref:hypothetical protein n=1 Tax=Mycoplasmopsis cynos TaxID=171284 RepID=UPI002201FF69|nr:hypothetical protein [Mycoplasmopsis cynos]UWV92893.1 hypothetical protein NWE57_02460 [Mycoplasmopsis cynos]